MTLAICACTAPADTFTAAEDTAANTIPPAQTPGTRSTTGSGETERETEREIETAAEEEKTPFSTDMVIANLNIKHGADGLDKVAGAIREVSPDII